MDREKPDALVANDVHVTYAADTETADSAAVEVEP